VNSSPWLSLIAPLGIKRGDYYQIFAGQQNENVYTNGWQGPFWGFRRVIQTFKLTDKPRRFKPMDIYFHFYSGSKRASINALREVFDWATAQDSIPIYTTSYIPKAMDFFYISIAKEREGERESYYIAGVRDLKSLRVEKDSFVDVKASKGVVGFNRYLKSRYIHLAPKSSEVKVVISN